VKEVQDFVAKLDNEGERSMTEGPYKLPEGWQWVKLGEVCQHRTGIWGPEASDPAQGFPIVRSTEIEGFRIRPQGASIRVVRTTQVEAYKLESGDILVSKSSGSPHLVGWPAIFEDPKDGKVYLFSNFMLRLRSDRRRLEPWFLLYYLHSPIARSVYLGAQDTTSGLRNLRVREFLAQPIPLPPLEEQKRIVARIEELMGRVREARRLREEAKQEAERLWQAVLAQTFPRPGSALPEGWRWVRLGEVCQHRTGIWGPEASDPAQGFPIVRSTEIEGFLIRPQAASVRVVRTGQVEAYKLESGDILVSKSSGSPHLVGWPAIFEDPQDGRTYLFSNFMLRLRVDRRSLEPWFLLYYLHSPKARAIYLGAQDTTSGLRNLRVREFLAQPILLPPLEEQRRIVAYLQEVQEKIKALKEAQVQTEEELKCLEQAILEKPFRGEL